MNVRNNVQLIGRLGLKPALTVLDGGRKVANISVATNSYYVDKTGSKVEQTEWHRVVAYGKIAEVFVDHTDKGSEVLLYGELRTRKYTAKDGSEHYVTEVICNSVHLMGSPKPVTA